MKLTVFTVYCKLCLQYLWCVWSCLLFPVVFTNLLSSWSNCHFTYLFSSVQLLSHVQLFATHGLQHTRPPCSSPSPGAYSNSHPSSQWCHPTISSSVVPFSSCLQSFPASGSFPIDNGCFIYFTLMILGLWTGWRPFSTEQTQTCWTGSLWQFPPLKPASLQVRNTIGGG